MSTIAPQVRDTVLYLHFLFNSVLKPPILTASLCTCLIRTTSHKQVASLTRAKIILCRLHPCKPGSRRALLVPPAIPTFSRFRHSSNSSSNSSYSSKRCKVPIIRTLSTWPGCNNSSSSRCNSLCLSRCNSLCLCPLLPRRSSSQCQCQPPTQQE